MVKNRINQILPFALLLMMTNASCSMLHGSTRHGYMPNANMRNALKKVGNHDISEIELAGEYFADPNGSVPVVIDDRDLVHKLVIALRNAETTGNELSNRGEELTLIDSNGKRLVTIPMDYGSASGYIGPMWNEALNQVQVSYARQLHGKIRQWGVHDQIALTRCDIISSGLEVLPGLGKMKLSPGVKLHNPSDVSQLIKLLKCEDKMLYAFDAPNRVRLRVERFGPDHNEHLYIVLPLQRSGEKLSCDSALLRLGVTNEVLSRLNSIL